MVSLLLTVDADKYAPTRGFDLKSSRFRVNSALSDIATLDLIAQGLDQVRDLFQMRVDSERLAEDFERAFVLAEILHDHAETCERAEMPGLAGEHLSDVGERAGVVVLHVVQRRAAVPALDIVGAQLDDRI